MRLDNGLGDGETHAGALHTITLISATVELLEDQRLLQILDSRSLIGHADGDRIP